MSKSTTEIEPRKHHQPSLATVRCAEPLPADKQGRTYGWQQVLEAERAAIQMRRRNVVPPLAVRPAENLQTVGLCLSGGGIRSAAFNLGLLQAFYRNGLLRHIDYLSTVSGGGYIGGWLSALVSCAEDKPACHLGGKDDPLRQCLTTGRGGQRPDAVTHIVRNGNYLDQPSAATSHYLIGLILNNLVLLSGAVFICVALAFVWRALDDQFAAAVLYQYSNRLLNEVIRPFLPALILFLTWILAWMWRYRAILLVRGYMMQAWVMLVPIAILGIPVFAGGAAIAVILLRSSSGRWPVVLLVLGSLLLCLFRAFCLPRHAAGVVPARWWTRAKKALDSGRATNGLIVATFVCLVIGFAVLLASPIVTPLRPSLRPDSEAPLSPGISPYISYLVGLVAAGLAPFLKPQRLLRSGLQPKSIWEKRVFNVATTALIAGVPLLGVWWFARHDFTGRNESRRWSLQIADVRNLIRWRERIKFEARNDPESLGYFIDERLNALPVWTQPDIDRQEYKAAQDRWLRRSCAAMASVESWFGIHSDSDASARGPKAIWEMTETVAPTDRKLCEEKNKIIQCLNESLLGCGVTRESTRTSRLLKTIFGDGFDDTSLICSPSKPREQFIEKVLKLVNGSKSATTDKSEQGAKPDKAERLRLFLGTHPKAKLITEMLFRYENHLLTMDEEAELARMLLEASYPDDIIRSDQVVRGNVIAADQGRRLWWVVGSLLLFLAAGLVVDLNATSLQPFYRDQLAATFLPGREYMKLREVKTTERGAPYHLLNATLNSYDAVPDLDGQVSTKIHHHTELFLFSGEFCGARSDSIRFQKTGEYMLGMLSFSGTMAVSGAALSPMQVRNPFAAILMTVFNFRTGMWVPNPRREAHERAQDLQPKRWLNRQLVYLRWQLWRRIPSFTRIFHEYSRRSAERAYHSFITDGGHHDNLGLEALLERRCRLIIVSDATQDESAGFLDLMCILRRMRVEKGIRIVNISTPGAGCSVADDGLESLLALLRPAVPHQPKGILDFLVPGDAGGEVKNEDKAMAANDRSKRHFFAARIVYPKVERTGALETGCLIYLKPTLTGDEPTDLLAYAARELEFPHHPTADQLFDEERFESYRQLGEHIGEKLGDTLARSMSGIQDGSRADSSSSSNSDTVLWRGQESLGESPDDALLRLLTEEKSA
jgi:hypothetical protein